MRAIQTIGPECRPRRAAFHEADAQRGELIEDAVIYHAGKRDHQLKRVTETMNRHEGFEGIETQTMMGTAMHA